MGYSLTENPTELSVGNSVSFQQAYNEGALGGTSDITGISPAPRTNETANNSIEIQKSRQRSNSKEPKRDFIKRETIPEFVPVSNIQHIYQIFCDANKKNKLLI